MVKEYRKEEFKDLAELLIWASERKPVFFSNFDNTSTPSDMIQNLTENFKNGKYKKAIEILGQLYVCIKELESEHLYIGDLCVIPKDGERINNYYWKKCTMDSKGIVKSVVSDS